MNTIKDFLPAQMAIVFTMPFSIGDCPYIRDPPSFNPSFTTPVEKSRPNSLVSEVSEMIDTNNVLR